MSYTHYFERRSVESPVLIDAEARKSILAATREIVERHRDILTGDVTGLQQIPVDLSDDATAIALNGIREDAYELFYFDLYRLNGYAFCDTARKPYDLPVCEILIVLAHYLQGLLVTSNGFPNAADGIDNSEIAPEARINKNWLTAAKTVWQKHGIKTKLFAFDAEM